MIVLSINLRIPVLIAIIVASAIACSKEQSSNREDAVKMARDEVISLSKKLNGHVQIEEKLLLTMGARASNEGGWHVTLVQGECTYMVYAYPGHEIDVTGASEGCFTK
jgi:hypothetical protein